MGQTIAKRPGFIGSRFGRLTVLGKHGLTSSKHLLVSCKCDCGNETVVRWSSLNRPEHYGTLSCGCIVRERARDLTGQRFGRLLVLERAGSNEKCNALWRCRCDCGKELLVVGTQRAMRRSCGCLKREQRSALGKRMMRIAIDAHKLPLGQAACKQLLRQYERNARMRDLEWSLTIEQAIRLFESCCEYCGREPVQQAGTKLSNGRYCYNGIDRVDSAKGYTLENSVPCCKWCNWIKGRNTLSEFYANVARIARHHPEILANLVP